MLEAGRYQNASEAIRDAVRGLQQRRKEDDLKLALLCKHVKAGIDDLAQGRYDEIDEKDLETEFEKFAGLDRR